MANLFEVLEQVLGVRLPTGQQQKEADRACPHHGKTRWTHFALHLAQALKG